MKALERTSMRLIRHDRDIAVNTMRATFSGWHDRLIAGTMLLAGLAGLQAWAADRQWRDVAMVATGASVMCGVGAGRWLATRLAFHTSDGLFAADALHRPTRRRYVATWHAIGVALMALVTLVTKPSLLFVSVPAFLIGAVVAGMSGCFGLPSRLVSATRARWTLRTWLQRPLAGQAAAGILLMSLLPARMLDSGTLMAIAGLETLVLSLALTRIDHRVVRFMATVGQGVGRTIGFHAGALAWFSAIAVPVGWLMAGPMAAGIVAAVTTLVLLFLTLRVLAYRLHGKNFAEILVSILVGLLALVTYAIPIALPVATFVILWRLRRRAAATTWLLT